MTRTFVLTIQELTPGYFKYSLRQKGRRVQGSNELIGGMDNQPAAIMRSVGQQVEAVIAKSRIQQVPLKQT